MKFLLGMLVMYLIVGIVSIVVNWFTDDDDLVFKIIALPEFLVILVGSKVYKFIKYYNTKSIFYVKEHNKWYYCERKDFDYFNKKYRLYGYDISIMHKVEKELYDKYSYEFERYYNNPIRKNFLCFPNTFNSRYVPKSVWNNFGKATRGLGKEDIFLNK